MKNPEFAFARALGASAHPATFEVSKEQDETSRRGISFALDLFPGDVDGPDEVDCISTLAWADSKTPVAVLGICLGKLFLAAALNPLDPPTRAFMQRVSQAGALPYSVVFDAGSNSSVDGKVRVSRSVPGTGLFAEALRVTESMKASAGEWCQGLAAHTMAHALLDEGFNARVRAPLLVRAFNVVSKEMELEEPELLAVC